MCLIQLPHRRSPERDPKAQTGLKRTEMEEVSCEARAQIPVLSQNVAGTATTTSCHSTFSRLAPLWVDWGLRGEVVMGSPVACWDMAQC